MDNSGTTKKGEEIEKIGIDKPQEWIIPCSLKIYDLYNALKELKILDWKQSRMIKNAKVGDLVYIYVTGVKESYIAFKGVILKVNKEVSTIDDSKFSVSGDVGSPFMEVAMFREFSFVDELSRSNLKLHGLKSKMQGPNKVKPELAEYLHQYDRLQRQADRLDGTIPDTCLPVFPIQFEEYIEPDLSFSEKKKYIKNEKKLKDALYKFCTFIHEKDGNGAKINFNEKSGYLYKNENYKKDIFKEVQNILKVDEWNEQMLKTNQVSKRVIDALSKAENLIYWQGLDEIKKKLPKVEKELFDLYTKELTEEVFNQLTDTIGAKYAIIAYLLFIKDSKRYLPASPVKFDAIFEMLEIPFKMSSKCSYENYNDYCNIIKEIQDYINNDKSFTNDIELLDAHSFLWVLGSKEFYKWSNELYDYKESLKEEIREIENKDVKGKDRETLVKQRVNQGVFRNRLTKRYNHCCLCDVSDKRLLRASHIKPWSESDEDERVDENNGLLLCPNHDVLFDGGFISFDEDGKILISKQLSDIDKGAMKINVNMKIDIAEESKKYFDYHRVELFKK